MDGSSSPSSQDDPDPGPGAGPEPWPGVQATSVEVEEQPSSPEPEPDSKNVIPESSAAAMKKEKARVRFNSNAAATSPPILPLPQVSVSIPQPTFAPGSGSTSRPQDQLDGSNNTAGTTKPSGPSRPTHSPRPSVLRGNSYNSVFVEADDVESQEAKSAAARAQERAKQVAAKVRRDSDTPSRHSSESAETATSEFGLLSEDGVIPLQLLPTKKEEAEGAVEQRPLSEEAYKLVQAHARRFGPRASPLGRETPTNEPEGHGPVVEVNDGLYDGVYNVPAPQNYRGSVLSQLLKLYKPGETAGGHNRNSMISLPSTIDYTPTPESGASTPKRTKWYHQNKSQETLANLVEASARLANPNMPKAEPSPNKKRPAHRRRTSSNSRAAAAWQREEVRITAHIAETLARQEYIIKLCRSLMLYGAPTHRLEEYLAMTARFLEIDGQFLYLPGCMIISFDDKSTHTAEIRIVRSAQGIDLGKLKDVHLVYKEVMHDVVSVEEGTMRLDELMAANDKYHPWFRVLIFGLTSVTAAPFSFKARLIDLPLIFCFGCLIGILQLIIAPRSDLYNNVFEVSASIIISFLARAFGSIAGGSLFCFSALAQSGIVMLLPGYLVLCSALEIQSHAIVPGSIRIVYAIIYSLLLGFGITVGAVLFGFMDKNATSNLTCENPLSDGGYWIFLWVPLFTICISILYQAKWRQLPAMVVVAFAGYVVNFFTSQKLSASPQIANTLGAFTVGVLANLYSRIRHGVAAATLIPAIFVQVPGGLAASGGLLSGLVVANEITNSNQEVNGTGSVELSDGQSINTVVFNVAASMIQIAIGIAVGLFMSALIIYPLGKRRSGLFSF